ncbi:unnamed protein product [Phaedon cochleariae]|uniref:DMA domain-containing protein n=1 Tax=Phaedon cochleariae TaxID=80249 RepID=A0A9N9SG55_PHACE|nr:unnamed protein product [Phaedon cochleariae]
MIFESLPRINVEDCSLADSDSDQDDSNRPRHSPSSPARLPAPLAPTPSPDPVASPDHDLDVEEDTPPGEAPENLSVKRETRPSPETTPPPLHGHAHGFVAYHQQFSHQFAGHFQPQLAAQRSPVDVLMRVFPGRRRCKGDVLQAMELMVSGVQEDLSAPSAFSPLGPPPAFHRYGPARRFLAAPYAGTGYLPTVIRPPPDYLSLVGQVHEAYKGGDNATASSPGSNTGSDKTSYSE